MSETRINLRVSEEQKIAWAAAAGRCGRTLANWIKFNCDQALQYEKLIDRSRERREASPQSNPERTPLLGKRPRTRKREG